MSTQFKSFEAWGKSVNQKKEEEKGRTNNAIEKLFATLSSIPEGNYSTRLQGVDSISITKPEGENPKNLNITFYYETEGKTKSLTLPLFKDGTLSGGLPKDLPNLSKDGVKKEVVDIFDRIQLPLWEMLDPSILPPEQTGIPVQISPGSSSKKLPRMVIERIEMLVNQPDVLFGGVDKAKGFEGYHLLVFPKFMVLEHPSAQNAAFFVLFKEAIPTSDIRFDFPPGQRLSSKQRKNILDQYWLPIKDKTKPEVVQLGVAERVRHLPKDNWMEQMQKELDKRR